MVRYRSVLLIILAIALIPGAHAAAVHGALYSWSDFEKPLKNAILEIDSIPVQSRVAIDGTYAFDDLPAGNYTINAKYYRNNVLELEAEEDIRIADTEGNFNIDILLFPPTDSELEYLGDINLTTDMELKSESDFNSYFIIVLILIAGAAALFYLSRKKKTPVPEVAIESIERPTAAGQETRELPEDLHELYALITKKGGRVTQKDLRGEMKCSEAKVSLMLDDLEDRGYIKKIKKGRSNIIIAQSKKDEKEKTADERR